MAYNVDNAYDRTQDEGPDPSAREVVYYEGPSAGEIGAMFNDGEMDEYEYLSMRDDI